MEGETRNPKNTVPQSEAKLDLPSRIEQKKKVTKVIVICLTKVRAGGGDTVPVHRYLCYSAAL